MLPRRPSAGDVRIVLCAVPAFRRDGLLCEAEGKAALENYHHAQSCRRAPQRASPRPRAVLYASGLTTRLVANRLGLRVQNADHRRTQRAVARDRAGQPRAQGAAPRRRKNTTRLVATRPHTTAKLNELEVGVYALASPFATPSCIYTGHNPYFSAALTPAKMSVHVSAACETPRQRCGVV